MIERAGGRIRVGLTGHLSPDDAKAAATQLSALADQILAEVTPAQVDRVRSDALAALEDVTSYGVDTAGLAQTLAQRLIAAGYRPPA